MRPHTLALRTLLLGNTRSILAIVLIAASLCVLDLVAGHIASARARLEQQAVIGERLGHLAIVPPAGPGIPMFEPDMALRIQKLAQSTAGVALAVPQLSVSGIAATNERSALFFAEGIVPDGDRPGAARGTLNPATENGIALSSRDASALGVANGSNVTLSGATLTARTPPVDARVVDVYSVAGSSGLSRDPVLMPLSLARMLVGTERTERIVVYLAEPVRIDERRLALTAALRAAGIPALVKTWQEQSPAYASERGATDVVFDGVAGMVFAVIAAAVAATISMNALERRREIGTLRAFGMRSSSVFLMLVMEGLWMALVGVAISIVASSVIAWVVNRVALSYATGQAAHNAPMLVELDFMRMAVAVLSVLAVALLAALVPAFKAARGPIAPTLAS